METVYLSLGGNIGDRKSILQQAIGQIGALPEIQGLRVSSFYETSPVECTPQSDYLNAVCCFKTRMDAHGLFESLQSIEQSLGKEPKPKNHPRPIDIDILFFGNESFHDDRLEIPHPRWCERLFVVIPLLDLISTINIHDETIDLIKLRDSMECESQRIEKLS